jgi:hypothetical protein
MPASSFVALLPERLLAQCSACAVLCLPSACLRALEPAGRSTAPRLPAVLVVQLECGCVLGTGRGVGHRPGQPHRGGGTAQDPIGPARSRRVVVPVTGLVHPDAVPVGGVGAGGIRDRSRRRRRCRGWGCRRSGCRCWRRSGCWSRCWSRCWGWGRCRCGQRCGHRCHQGGQASGQGERPKRAGQRDQVDGSCPGCRKHFLLGCNGCGERGVLGGECGLRGGRRHLCADQDTGRDKCNGHSRCECNAGPHGTSLRRARMRLPLLGVGGLRPIAFAPRTASGKASFVLALRHRVCGRFCVALGLRRLRVLFLSRSGTRTTPPGLMERTRAEPRVVFLGHLRASRPAEVPRSGAGTLGLSRGTLEVARETIQVFHGRLAHGGIFNGNGLGVPTMWFAHSPSSEGQSGGPASPDVSELAVPRAPGGQTCVP